MNRFFKHSANVINALAQNPKHKFASQHALNIYNADAVYSFIPKNACSTMRTSLAIANGCIESEADFNWIHKNNHTFSANMRDMLTAKYTFVILRCPFSRLVSSYLDKIVNRNLQAWAYVNMHQREIEIENISFDFFVKSLKTPRIRNGDIHWRPQSDFLVYKHYDDYFSLENFSYASETLKNKINLDVVDARGLTKHGVESYTKVQGEDFSKTKPLEFLQMKAGNLVPSTKSLFNEELIQLVKQIYSEDFALYKDVIGEDGLMF